jgi:ferritin-like protein
MTQQEIRTLERVIGMLNGISYCVETNVGDALLDVTEMLNAMLDAEDKKLK